mgnify:CR=1 FL=1
MLGENVKLDDGYTDDKHSSRVSLTCFIMRTHWLDIFLLNFWAHDTSFPASCFSVFVWLLHVQSHFWGASLMKTPWGVSYARGRRSSESWGNNSQLQGGYHLILLFNICKVGESFSPCKCNNLFYGSSCRITSYFLPESTVPCPTVN